MRFARDRMLKPTIDNLFEFDDLSVLRLRERAFVAKQVA
jgi:hypothetical protein